MSAKLGASRQTNSQKREQSNCELTLRPQAGCGDGGGRGAASKKAAARAEPSRCFGWLAGCLGMFACLAVSLTHGGSGRASGLKIAWDRGGPTERTTTRSQYDGTGRSGLGSGSWELEEERKKK